MDKFIINLKNGVECAGPFVNKYNQNFDAIRFFIDDSKDFSACSFAVVVSAFDDVCMISEDGKKLSRGTEDEKTYLDWILGSEVTSADGVVIYQVVAYKAGENGTVEAIWHSPEGRIFVGDSIDTTEYESSQIGSQPGILMQILSNMSFCKENTDSNRESIESLSETVSEHGGMIEDNEKRIEKNENDIKDMEHDVSSISDSVSEHETLITKNQSDINGINSQVSDISLRLSVEEELTHKNTQEISKNVKAITDNEENISLVTSQVNIIKQEISGLDNSVRLINNDIENQGCDIELLQSEITDCKDDITINKDNIFSCADRLDCVEDQIVQTRIFIEKNESVINGHSSDISNPHKVSASQIGLGNVDNTSDMDKPLSNAAKEEFKSISDKIDSLGDRLFHSKSESLDYFNEERITFPYQNKSLDRNGGLIDYNGSEVSDYINLKKFGQIYKHGYNSLLAVYVYCFYDENFNLIQYCPRYVPENFSNINGYTKAIEYTLLPEAKYVRICNEMIRTNFKYMAVPRKIVYDVDETILDKSSKFLFHAKENIVNFGDSIFGNDDSSSGVSNLIALYTNSTVYNCAFGGTRMIARTSTTTGYDKFDFSTLMDAIISNDYSSQEEAISLYNLPSYYSKRLETLKSVDFEKINIVTLNFGSNDYIGGISISKFIEKYIEVVGKFQEKFPHINVVLITPTWRCWLDEEDLFVEDSNTKEYNGNTLIDFTDAYKQVAQTLNIPLVDVYNIGINKNNWTRFFLTSDTTHHDVLGRDRLARVIARALTLIA